LSFSILAAESKNPASSGAYRTNGVGRFGVHCDIHFFTPVYHNSKDKKSKVKNVILTVFTFSA
jgi:hypothetical protein